MLQRTRIAFESRTRGFPFFIRRARAKAQPETIPRLERPAAVARKAGPRFSRPMATCVRLAKRTSHARRHLLAGGAARLHDAYAQLAHDIPTIVPLVTMRRAPLSSMFR